MFLPNTHTHTHTHTMSFRIPVGGGADYPHQSSPALKPTQPSVKWIPCVNARGKAAGA